MGAAGRDFHNFNTYFRDRGEYRVVAFTAAQIPHIDGRVYPPSLAGRLYPQGIPIIGEERLEGLIKENGVDLVVFAYSDVSYNTVMHMASRAIASGSDFMLLGTRSTWLESSHPVISICATRTGSGKSQTTRRVCDILEQMGRKVAVIRHPMPYGDLEKQAVQKFKDLNDLDLHNCTIEEREEYEPHIKKGRIVFAGVDYGEILKLAEKESEIIVWDGGNNDLPFYRPDLHIVVVDPFRAGHQTTSYPGEANLRMADAVVINKIDSAPKENIEKVKQVVHEVRPQAKVIMAESPISADTPELIKDRRVLVVEDGPTLTHGDMEFGAGMVAARKFGAKEIVDPRRFAVGEIRYVYEKYPHVKDVIPAMGYGEAQMRDLEKTINSSDAEVVVSATPADLSRLMKIRVPLVRITYELKEIGQLKLDSVIAEALEKRR
ncbi:MAG: cyclic 2,3-diphosphoglycerate synthase [bacterium]